MTWIVHTIPSMAFLAAGVYLALNGHAYLSALCIVVAAAFVPMRVKT